MGSASAPLDAVVVGAGICGLASAVALRRAGHRVTVYEKYAITDDAGAGIVASANANRVLQQWGLDLGAMGAVEYTEGMLINGLSCTVIKRMPVPKGQMMTTRSDLRRIIKLEAEKDISGSGSGSISIVYGVDVVDYDISKAAVQFADGGWREADLVVACDGIRSKAALRILGSNSPAKSTGYSAFRLLIPTERLEAIKETYKDHPLIAAKLADGTGMSWISTESPSRIFVWWPCRFGTFQAIDINIPDNETYAGSEEWLARCDKSVLLKEFEHWHPIYADILKHADKPMLWKLCAREPVDTLYKGRTCILGDALHPMGPYRAQGSSQAIEDAAMLEMCFRGVTGPTEVPARLALLQKMRIPRCASIQLASTVRQSDPAFHQTFDAVLAQCRQRWFQDQDLVHLRSFDAFSVWMTEYDARAEGQKALAEYYATKPRPTVTSPQPSRNNAYLAYKAITETAFVDAVLRKLDNLRRRRQSKSESAKLGRISFGTRRVLKDLTNY